MHPDQDEATENFGISEEVSVFTVGARRRIGEAAGNRKRRDVVQNIRYIPGQDCYLTASQQGSLSVWSASKLRLVACADIRVSKYYS